MAKIKIITPPAGQAPEWVRQAWVGLELPVSDAPGQQSHEPRYQQRGVLGSMASPDNIGGYNVRTEKALEILRKENAQAAEWWDDHINPQAMPWLVFGKKFCELINEC